LSTLEEHLQMLNKDCRGLVPLQSNQADVGRANQLTSEREARLREALGAGDRQDIDLRRKQLDQARRALEAAKH